MRGCGAVRRRGQERHAPRRRGQVDGDDGDDCRVRSPFGAGAGAVAVGGACKEEGCRQL